MFIEALWLYIYIKPVKIVRKRKAKVDDEHIKNRKACARKQKKWLEEDGD